MMLSCWTWDKEKHVKIIENMITNQAVFPAIQWLSVTKVFSF